MGNVTIVMLMRMTSWRLLAMAIAGSLAGHQLAYAISPNDVVGHSYLAPFVPVLIALGVVAFGHGLIQELSWRTPVLSFRQLGALQVYLFASQEALERIVLGLPAWSILTEPVLWVGLAAQLGIAAALLLTVRGILLLASRLATRRLEAAPLTAVGAPAPWVPAGITRPRLLSPISPRAPPLIS